MDRIQTWRWRRLAKKWEKYKKKLGTKGEALDPVKIFFDAPLRVSVQEYWAGGQQDVRDVAIQARVAYLTARWTFWLMFVTALLFATTTATLLYTMLTRTSCPT